MPRPAFLPDLPSLSTSQSCATWRNPPLDGSLSVPEIIEWNGQHNKDHPLFVYPFGDTIRSILWPEFSSAVKLVAHTIVSSSNIISDTSVAAPVIAILASTDVISYQTLFFGILQADCIPFPISPRNSATAVAHLLHTANVGRVFLGHDDVMRQLMEAALLILTDNFPNESLPVVSDILLFDDVYGQDRNVASDSLPTSVSGQLRDVSEPAFIMHSSGSTSFPKLIPTSHRHIFEAALVPFFGSRNMSGKILSTHGLPSFHGLPMGMLLFSATCGSILGAFQPRWPPIAPTPEHCFEGMKATNSDYAVCVPSFVEAWALNPDHVEWFRSRQGIIYAGGPLAKATGDNLILQGVSVFSMYGSTESGILSVYLPATVDMDWEYFQFSKSAGYKMIPNGNDTFEYMILPSPWWTLTVINAKIDGLPAYASSDLFTPHATKPGFWKVFGRNDDQIMHSTGEKTNPGPLEIILSKDPHVHHSVMFGRGRFHAGVIVEPVLQHQVDPADASAVASFRNKIWPTVEKMNVFAPQHSRIFKEMILIASPKKPFSLTSKNAPRRQIILEDYEDEINALYDTVEETTQAVDTMPNTWDIVSTTAYVRTIVNKVLVRNINDEDDLFQQGACDSLQATWIRNTLLRALRENAELDARGNADNFIYHYPTIALLSKHVHDLAHGEATTALASQEEKAKHMADMVKKHIVDLPLPSGVAPLADACRVLLVGPTGSLGSHILERLLTDNSVSKVFALGRPSDTKTLRDRVLADFQVRGLDEHLLTKVDKVVYLEGDLTRDNLGLSTDVYDELRASVTSIISNSWRVDFNLGLSSFESNMKGLRGVVDLALRSTFKAPPRLMFISSIGVLHHAPPTFAKILEGTVQADFAIGNGYCESKWVAEEILKSVASQTTLRPLIVRVGQVCGGRNGFWNSKEWFPSMVQSALQLGAFPYDDRPVSWLPVHVAAEGIVDFLKAPEDITVLHIAHPRPVSGRLVAETIAARLSVTLVSSSAWLDKLEKAAEAALKSTGGIDVQAFRFLHVFRTIAESTDDNREVYGMVSMSMSNALSASPSLSSSALPSLSGTEVDGWMSYWESTGLFK